MKTDQRVFLLKKAMVEVRKISHHYDDVLRDVSAQIAAKDSVGKGEIAALAFWKRIRTDSWVEDFLCLSETKVREVTRPVVATARQPDVISAASRARELLRDLPGFRRGSAMASAVLTAIRPNDLGIYDRNANKGLEHIGLALAFNESNHYAEYTRRIQQCRAEVRESGDCQWTGHDVDLALYMLGRTPSIIDR